MKRWKGFFFSSLILATIGLPNMLPAQTSNDISQKEGVIKLKETVVVATREEEEIIRVPGNVTIISSDDIIKSTAKDIPALLRKESGPSGNKYIRFDTYQA